MKVQLLNLRKTPIRKLDPMLVRFIQGLYEVDVIPSVRVLANICNVDKGTACDLLRHDPEEPVASINHPQMWRAASVDTTVRAAWATLHRPWSYDVMQECQKRFNLQLSLRYVRNVLTRTGLTYRMPQTCQMLSLEDKQRRLAFCTALLANDEAWFARLVFSDEKYFTLRYGMRSTSL